MNKNLLMLFCATSLTLGAVAANAQEADRMPPPPPPHEDMAPMPPRDGMFDAKKFEEKMRKREAKMDKKMAEELNLTKEQQEQAKKIREEGREKMKPLMEKFFMTRINATRQKEQHRK